MKQGGPRTKWVSQQSLPCRHSSGEEQYVLRHESSVLDAISRGEPFPVVLNSLCVAIDLQVGNIVTIVSLADCREDDQGNDQECELPPAAQGALQFGLHLLWSGNIAGYQGELLGYLDVYCCISRVPSPLELLLFDRATHLAALAIQRHQENAGLETLGADVGWRSAFPTRRFEVN